MKKILHDGWHSTKLKQIILAIESGVSANGEAEPAIGDQIGVLKVSAVTSGHFDATQNKRVTSEQERQRLKCPVSANSIVMTRSNGSVDLVGACVFVKEDYPNLFLSDKLWKLILEDESRDESRWLYYLLCSYPIRQRIIGSSSGSVGMRNVSKSELLGITVRRPPLPEQQKIAIILSTWDWSIELTKKLISAKRKRKQGLMQQLLTGDVRFAEYDGDPWTEVKLGEVFRERRETGNVDLPLLSITSGEGIVHRDTIERKDSSNADKSKYLRICPGDIGYNTMRMWQGVSALSDHEGIVSPAYTICTPNSDVDARFMSYLFKYPPVIHMFWRYSQGMVSDTLNLKYSSFSTIKLRIPKQKDEQRKIGEVLLAADKELRGLVRQVEQLSQQKKGLMQQLLTGKVRVNTDQETVKG